MIGKLTTNTTKIQRLNIHHNHNCKDMYGEHVHILKRNPYMDSHLTTHHTIYLQVKISTRI